MIREQRMRVELPAVISLGSNLGDREGTLLDAVTEIAEIPGVTITAISGIVESTALTPAGLDESAPPYLNAVVAARVAIPPEELLESLTRIEARHGRVRAERWADRTLDIDIIAMGSLTVSSERLTLPHPRAAERAFVLAPWLEIEPDARLHGYGQVSELLAGTEDSVRPFVREST